jgi:Fe-Mn family superoxide dismutase
MGQYSLPELGFAYKALAPIISEEIMELHHSKHHAAYVKGCNDALEQLDDARAHNDFSRVASLEKALAFNLSGHILHSIFWQNLQPTGGGEPAGELRMAIDHDFGSFEAFKHQLIGVASSVMGSGWAALVYEPLAGRLLTAQIYDHQSNTNQGSVPLLVLDAWEHAYYLQYKNEKAKFFQAVWELWNWQDISERFVGAKRSVGFDWRKPRPEVHSKTS